MADINQMRMEQGGTAPSARPEQTRSEAPLPPLPPDAMIIMPVRNFVLFPGIVMPVTAGRQRSVAAAQQAAIAVEQQARDAYLHAREARLAPGRWELSDLRDYDLPFFDSAMLPGMRADCSSV